MGLNSCVAFMSHLSKKLNMSCFGLFGGQVRKWPCIPSKPRNVLIQCFLSKSQINVLIIKEIISRKYQTQLKIWQNEKSGHMDISVICLLPVRILMQSEARCPVYSLYNMDITLLSYMCYADHGLL